MGRISKFLEFFLSSVLMSFLTLNPKNSMLYFAFTIMKYKNMHCSVYCCSSDVIYLYHKAIHDYDCIQLLRTEMGTGFSLKLVIIGISLFHRRSLQSSTYVKIVFKTLLVSIRLNFLDVRYMFLFRSCVSRTNLSYKENSLFWTCEKDFSSQTNIVHYYHSFHPACRRFRFRL